jgi:hypothetical protein
VLNHDLFLSNANIRDAIGGPPRIGGFAVPAIRMGGSLVAPSEGAQAARRRGEFKSAVTPTAE